MSNANAGADSYVMPRWMGAWERFWFTPMDPTVLALIRITSGLIVTYTMIAYSFVLQDFMGEHAWHDLQLRLDIVRERPVPAGSLQWGEAGPLQPPRTLFEMEYLEKYRTDWGFPPPPPYPANAEEAKFLDEFRKVYGIDMRINGLRIPRTEEERTYLGKYMNKWGRGLGPPPAYVANVEEENAIDDYITRQGQDPRRMYGKGIPVFSFWFHVLDPQAMAILHGAVIVVAFLFTIGFCTRVTSALLWFCSLSYVHRNPTVLFGVDTMMTIVLLYMMIGPSGAAYSVDRLIRRWWVRAKPGLVARWYGLLRLPVPAYILPAEPVPDVPLPSVSANVAIRLLQINVGMVYLMSGLAKLLGQAWWNGTAVWLTVANYEFAPMQFDWYVDFLRLLGRYQVVYEAFITGSGLFTLAFEISYMFLIWRPRLRWVFLTGAVLLHGGIGLFMGLKTFSLMMLAMNMSFLRKEEAVWLLSLPSDPLSIVRLFRRK